MIRKDRGSRGVVSRREFLRLSVMAAAGAVIGGRGLPRGEVLAAAPVERIAQPPASVLAYQEAPELAELVAQGLLPPVADRLPLHPCVVPVLHGTGKYDALMNRGFTGVSDRWGPTKMKDHGLVWFNHDLTLLPHLCESWEVNADASEYIFHLRQGTRWSDGVEFTSADFVWWYQHFALNDQLTDGQGRIGGRLGTVAAYDSSPTDGIDNRPYGVKVTFAEPYPLFPYSIARGAIFYPAHYLQRYHADTCGDAAALNNEAVAAGYADWVDYFLNHRSQWAFNPALPELGPWIARNTINEDIFLMERNPYYYGVDSANNQLPYTNTVSHRRFNLVEDFTNMVTSGKIDFQARHTTYSNYAEYKAHETDGGYKVVLGTSANHLALQLNLTTKDARLQAFFRERNVRLALSQAINRGAINTDLFSGNAVPRQYSPLSDSKQYYAKLSNAYIAFNPVEANTLLDALHPAKDGQGFRLWNGTSERIHFLIEGTAQAGSSEEAAVQRVRQNFAQVGIDTTYQSLDRAVYVEHYSTNEIQAAWWGGDRTVLPLSAPWIFLGAEADRPWSCAWALWYVDNDDPNGEAPPLDHWIRTIWEIWDQISVESSETQRDALFFQILDIWATELPMIGVLGEIPAPVIMKNNMRNYDEGYPIDDPTADEHLLSPETYFWDSTLASTLTINHNTGGAGSFFTLTGANYPPNSTALVLVNGTPMETLFTSPTGSVQFILSTQNADLGRYDVEVRVNPRASTSFELRPDEPVQPKEGDAVELDVPEGIAKGGMIYLPLLSK